MELRKYRWSKVYESSEEELIRLLAAKHINAERLVVDEGEELAERTQPNDTRMWCAEGQLVFTVNGKQLSFQSGDTLDIPAGTVYEARAGLGGCAYYAA